jgi:SAM-dependent methyltransferase
MEDARRMAEGALAHDDATGWFEQLYLAAEGGDAEVPWDRDEPQVLLSEWAEAERLDGRGRRALVVGCGLGLDAELLAGRGFATVAFDVAPTAVATARRRFPGSAVDYVTADLLDLPAAWIGAFDLVYESLTVQSLPPDLHPAATRAVASAVAPGGTLLVVAAARHGADVPERLPWPLTADEIAAFADGDLRVVTLEDIREPGDDTAGRWRAVFRRDGGG